MTCSPTADGALDGGSRGSVTLNCVHFWRIAPPAGPTSAGVCLKCGAERQFRNSLDDCGPAERMKAHTMYCTPGSGTLGPLRIAEGCRE